MVRSLEALTRGLIDYAGLFPPAKLDMQPAVENYARYLVGEHHAMLGRFICPASRLDELSQAAAALMPGTYATSGYREQADGEAWRISVVGDQGLVGSIEAGDAFGARHSEESAGRAIVDAIELRAPGVSAIDEGIEEIPEDWGGFFEMPWDVDPRGFVTALAGDEGCGAKIRCGGVTPDLIPPVEKIADFLVAAAAGGVLFKATAGLHHPVRAEHPLSYADDAPRGVMHGFLNVFLGAALARRGVERDGLIEILSETDPKAFAFDDDHAAWRDERIATDEIADTRSRFALSYGSCSFEEPIEDLQANGWM